MNNLLHSEITGQIIKAFYKVYNTLGFGFLEKVYERALAAELEASGFQVHSQQPIKVYYNGKNVGDYFADLIVENKIILEIKTASSIDKTHEAQLLNYLKATELEVGLILNFGEKAEYRRKVFANQRKDLIKNLLNP
ncbi:MAG: GxxExxY protein [Pyrinomonadaceae bacterium]